MVGFVRVIRALREFFDSVQGFLIIAMYVGMPFFVLTVFVLAYDFVRLWG